jgi:hypothetical protein
MTGRPRSPPVMVMRLFRGLDDQLRHNRPRPPPIIAYSALTPAPPRARSPCRSKSEILAEATIEFLLG